MITIGLLVSDSELVPRMRIRVPAPVCVPGVINTPAARDVSTSAMLATGRVSTSWATSSCAMALPTSTRRCCPVAVVTTGFRVTGRDVNLKSSVAVCPATTVAVWRSSP